MSRTRRTSHATAGRSRILPHDVGRWVRDLRRATGRYGRETAYARHVYPLAQPALVKPSAAGRRPSRHRRASR